MSEVIAKRSVFTKSSPESVWDVLYQINNWPKWDASIEAIELLETPKEGATGRIHQKGGASVFFTITKMEKGKTIVFVTHSLWGTLTRDYRIIRTSEGTVVEFTVSYVGFAEKATASLLRRKLSKQLEAMLARLKIISEAEFGEKSQDSKPERIFA